jgi:hypothetical protein
MNLRSMSSDTRASPALATARGSGPVLPGGTEPQVDIIEERGDEGAACIKRAHRRARCPLGHRGGRHRESMMQAIGATRPGGHLGYVGVTTVTCPATSSSSATHTCTAIRHRCAASSPSSSTSSGTAPSTPRQGLRPHSAVGPGSRRLPSHGRTPRHQDPAPPVKDTPMGIIENQPSTRGPAEWFTAAVWFDVIAPTDGRAQGRCNSVHMRRCRRVVGSCGSRSGATR